MDADRAGAPAWSGPALLVPVAVEALAITEAAYTAEWSWSPPNYNGLSVFVAVDPTPLSGAPPRVPGSAKFCGALLHWALPDGLTHGTASGDGVSYPAIPNRWLVTRKAPAADGSAWAYASWVVASDYAGGKRGSPWPNATATGATTIGASWALDQWPGEAVVGPRCVTPPLTAIGAGDATFAAFTPNVVNVVSIGDDLSGVPRGPVSYSVAGWYASPALDPMLGAASYGPDGWQTPAQWDALMKSLRWSVGDEADVVQACEASAAWAAAHGFSSDAADPHSLRPARTLCHGTVCGIPWEGPTAPFVSGVPTADPHAGDYVRPEVVVAHTAVDGIATLLSTDEPGASQPATTAEILEAFVHDALPVLDRADGVAQLALGVQEAWFNSTAGGTTWSVRAGADGDSTSGTEPALDSGVARSLTETNEAQQRLDSCEQEIAALQTELFDLWWKGERLAHYAPPPKGLKKWQQLVAEATPPLEAELEAQLAARRVLRTQRDTALVTLTGELGDLVLVAGTRPPFLRPNDPVVLVTGAHRARRHGEDGRFRSDGTLFCRFTGQTVAGVQVEAGAAPVTVDTADFPLPSPAATGLPLELPDLVAESFFLDLDDAPVLAAALGQKAGVDPWSLLAQVRAEQTLIWNPDVHPSIDRRTISQSTGLQFMYGLGALPSKVSVTVHAPPWAPLYLDWAFEVIPGSASPGDALSQWDLPLSDAASAPLDEMTYRWTGPVPARGTGDFSLKGRTFLTPQATDVLGARLERFIQRYADDPDVQRDLWALQDALEYVQNADVLSQSLSAFNAMLLTRSPSTFGAPAAGSIREYLYPPDGPSANLDSVPAPVTPDAPDPYTPIRDGHMQLTQLWIVDAFGQVFKILDPSGGALPPDSSPAVALDLQTERAAGTIELKPRLSQFARLDLTLLDAADDASAAGVDSDANPICGWIISNHLDRSAMFYDAAGALQGELLSAQDAALWLPPPEAAPPPSGEQPAVEIVNPHLRAIVEGILAQADTRAALAAFLELVDTALWSIDPTGGWADEELPALIGRPLAIVRGRLDLTLLGRPAYDQAWAATGERETGGFDEVAFAIGLGSTELLDDGLVGAYVNDDYRAISSPHAVDHPAGYVTTTRPTVTADGGALLTLLMDPSAKVHVFSGILPPLSATLPNGTTAPLADMEITFRTGPVLNDPAGVTLPLPGLRTGVWSWLQHQDPTRPAVEAPVSSSDPVPRLPATPPVLNEGWLKLLLREEPTKLTYSVVPGAVPATTDAGKPSDVALQLVAYNSSGAPLTWSEIRLTIPVGPGASDLTDQTQTIDAAAVGDSPWQAQVVGPGVVALTPVEGSPPLPAGATLRAVVAGVRVNDVAGSAAIAVRETTDATREATFPLVKVIPPPSPPQKPAMPQQKGSPIR